MQYLLKSVLNLIYPRYCEVCTDKLNNNESAVCMLCYSNLPLTNTWNIKDNELEKTFWGKLNLNHASALYFYDGNSPYRFLIYSAKYRNKPKIATFLGAVLGEKLVNSEFYRDVDFIVPVPLHVKRKKERGYNQSEYIARGISQTFNVPIDLKILSRGEYTETQTKKTKLERWDNVKEAFVVNNYIDLNGKHILLVDDVLTTGATLEACAKAILNKYNCKISVATLAYVPA